ncbi:THUMP domain-containing class I SAM-dependent RNA methyltransferase [Pelagibacterium montanilacus]|uniref:THUMP domain-containing class I SAM-dependent RNA methyltransferase n=1 Tax=Pelagibacterium montanilacus TaxID=2185280 RepID=UPI000F8D2CDA|nr:class I SAM-dependent RNA methyltransferase [Pelagibacterium montanilacus]
MTQADSFEIFLVCAPGLEQPLRAEALELGFAGARAMRGGVAVSGGWTNVMRANLLSRGAIRILARVASFRASHLAQLDKRARTVAWDTVLRPDVPVWVDASCKGSRIYHSGAAAERVATAIAQTLGAPICEDAPIRILVRIENDIVTLSVDTSGEPLHKRGHKQAVNRAPMRETIAALLLRACAYRGTEPVLDPMCGSGTFVIEAAEIAAGLAPGRSRAFAFEHLAPFDRDRWARMKGSGKSSEPASLFYGADRDQGAIAMSQANAERAGVAQWARFTHAPISALERPEGPPGLVMVNPPYGGRVGEKKALGPLYGALGAVLAERFAGWRVALVTSEPDLARATRLPFLAAGETIDNGGTRIGLYRTAPLA